MTQGLREEASRIAADRPDAIVTWPVSERRAFLLELAEHVRVEQGHTQQPFTRCVPSIVPQVADCPDPLVKFAALVDAVDTLAGFNTHPRWDAEADDAERKVGHLLDGLLGSAE